MRVVVPELITEARKAAGLTMDQVSERAKRRFGKAHVSLWESGKHTPRPENVELLMDVLGVTYEDLTMPMDELKARKSDYPKFFLHRVK